MASHSKPLILTGWTIDELLTAAEKQGTPATRRLVLDWVGLGLLDHPSKRGLGRGAGWAPGTLSEEQRQLFLLLLQKRGDVKHIRTLLNLPVAIWLIWGDSYVPLDQARRALTSWTAMSTKASKTQARKVARLLVEDLAHPAAGGAQRKALVEAVADVAVNPDNFDRETLMAAFRRALQPRTAEPLAGAARPLFTPEACVSLIEARLTAVRALPNLPDELLLEARDADRTLRPMYQRDQPYLATDPILGHRFSDDDLGEAVRNACDHLLTHLGFILLRSNNQPSNP
jgi:hypothetical protein